MKDKNTKTIEESGTEEVEEYISELESPIWSVIGFDRCFASGLTYEEAEAELKRRVEEDYSGLCIVTDEAAKRMNTKSVL